MKTVAWKEAKMKSIKGGRGKLFVLEVFEQVMYISGIQIKTGQVFLPGPK
jgi:hypothetical protein